MSDMVNSKKVTGSSSISCFKKDKDLIDAICFTYKMKQNELVSQMIKDKIIEITKNNPDKAELIEMMVKNSEKIGM